MSYLSQSDPPLYFVHIPKTAGSSLIALLDQAFSSALIAPPKRWEEFAGFAFAQCADYRLWRGHFGAHGLDLLAGPNVRRITVLRDPVALAYSRYRYIKRDPNTRLHNAVVQGQLSFMQFIHLPAALPLLSDPQCRSLSFRLDPAVSRAQLISGLLGPAPDAWIKARALRLPPEVQYEAAVRLLAEMPWFGLTEHFAESVRSLADGLGIATALVPHLLNSGDADPGELSEAARAAVLKRAPWDSLLYAQATELFKKRVLYCR